MAKIPEINYYHSSGEESIDSEKDSSFDETDSFSETNNEKEISNVAIAHEELSYETPTIVGSSSVDTFQNGMFKIFYSQIIGF